MGRINAIDMYRLIIKLLQKVDYSVELAFSSMNA